MFCIRCHRVFRIFVAFLSVCCISCFPLADSEGFAETTGTMKIGLDQGAFMDSKQGPWNISAAKISYDQEKQVYEAEGDVRISSGDRSIEADWALLDTEKQVADLRGHVRLRYGKDWLEGEHVLWNLKEETGTVDEGMVFFSENHFYVHGQSINKTGPMEYALKQGFITSCDPYKPDWKLRYGEMKVNLEGIAWARDTSFWVRNVPLLYTPFVALPVQQKRQSGFLLPWAGFSELNGMELEVPFYWAFREDMDATFYGRYMTKRGWMSGLEYRVASPRWGEGIWLFNYLSDEADKSHLEAQGYPFQTADRYWVRSRHSFELPYEIRGRLDLDLVSDSNYLKEFEKGSSSFDFSDNMFREFFGRGILNDETILARESSLYMDQRHESALLGLDVRYWDQLDRSLNEFTLQKLPSLSFSVIPSRFLGTPLFYSLDSSWVNYWRQEGDRGNRLDVFPRISYPMHWKSYLDIEPSVGVRANSYSVSWQEDDRNSWQGRLLSDVRLEMSSRLNRVYAFNMGNVVAMQHSIRPEVVYEYVPKGLGQDDIPQFDPLDADQTFNEIRYGVTNFFTSKSVLRDADGNQATTYHEFARLQLFHAFNFQPSEPNLNFDFERGEGASSVGMRLDLMPQKYVMLTYDTDFYSTVSSQANHDLIMTLDSGRGHLFRVDYQFRKDYPIDELITEFSVKIMPNVYVNTYHDYSFDKDELYKQGYGIKYIQGCWGLGLTYEKEEEDQRVALSINLLGLGSFGGTYAYSSQNSF